MLASLGGHWLREGLGGAPGTAGEGAPGRMLSLSWAKLLRRADSGFPWRARAGRRNNGEPMAAGSPVPEPGCGPPRLQHCENGVPARGTNEIIGCRRLSPYWLSGPASNALPGLSHGSLTSPL